jgi:hypothetical protein
MDRRELERSWAMTRRHLDSAFRLLAGRPSPTELEQYNEYLDHNELELAFTELEALGDVNRAPDSFWDELIAAAENMGVNEHTERCRKRLSDHRD